MAIKDLQTLYDEGHVASALGGSELLLIEQDGLSKVVTVETLAQYFMAYFEQNSECCADVAPCAPDTIYIVGDASDGTGNTDNDMVSATYSYDGSAPVVVTFAGSATKGQLLANMIFAINQDAGADLIDFGVGWTSKWSIGGTSGFGGRNKISGGDGSGVAGASDLVLTLTSVAMIDAVAILFGNEITVHSCGTQQWLAE